MAPLSANVKAIPNFILSKEGNADERSNQGLEAESMERGAGGSKGGVGKLGEEPGGGQESFGGGQESFGGGEKRFLGGPGELRGRPGELRGRSRDVRKFRRCLRVFRR